MNTNTQKCSQAFKNLAAAIEATERLPRNVFRNSWSNFYLFDSDWMFEGAFVEKVISLLHTEEASCACLVNLDRDVSDAAAKFVIDSETTVEKYLNRLRGAGPSDGWLYDIGRFCCVSDKGSWCIYCERSSELAVIGFQVGVLCEQFGSVLDAFHAGRVAAVLAGHADYELCSHVISREWKEEILHQYGDR